MVFKRYLGDEVYEMLPGVCPIMYILHDVL